MARVLIIQVKTDLGEFNIKRATKNLNNFFLTPFEIQLFSITLQLKVLLMKENNIHSELASIRNLMERSSKFISLSGLSGVMAGIYALIGGYFAYRLIYINGGIEAREYYINNQDIWKQLCLIALVVLILSVATGIWLTIGQAEKKGEKFWNPGSKRLFTNLAIPLIIGGMFILIILYRGYFGIIAPACLIFYGLGLISGSQYTFSDVRWLGFLEIALGLIASLFPAYGLIFWMIGFGLLHILYGAIMHFKYDK